MGGVERIGLFVTAFCNNRRQTRADLSAFSEGVDAIFVDEDVGRPPLGTLARTVLRTPVSTAGTTAFAVLFYPLLLAVCRNVYDETKEAVQDVGEEHDVPVESLQSPPSERLQEQHLGWVVLNWALLLGFGVFSPVSTALTVVLLLLVSTVPTRAGDAVGRVGSVGSGLAILAVIVVVTLQGYLAWPLLVVGFLVRVLQWYWIGGMDPEEKLDRLEASAEEHGYEDVTLVLTASEQTATITQLATDRGIQVPAAHVRSVWGDSDRHQPVDPTELPGAEA